MADDHAGHSHTPAITEGNERKVLLAFTITFFFMIVEAAGGFLSGSLALIADAGHMLTDAAALALAYAAFRFGRRAADQRRTYGYERFEVIAGLINAITLFAIVVWIVYEAVQRFRQPEQILAGPMMAVAVMGLLVNILAYRILSRGDTEHVNVRGAALHVLGDMLGSVGAIGAAIVIYFTGWMPIDPILSVVVALLILRSAWSLLTNSMHILLEGAPGGITPEAVSTHLKNTVPGLDEASHIHVWSLTSGKALATLHVRPHPDADPRRVAEAAQKSLMERFGIAHSTVAIDWPDAPDATCRLGDASAPGGTSDHENSGHDEHDHHGPETRH